MQNIQSKQQLRAAVRAQHAQQSPALIAAATMKVGARLAQLPAYKSSCTVVGFCGATSRGEIDTKPMLQTLLETGKLLGLPRVEGRLADGNMRLLQIFKLDDLIAGNFGLLEPPATAPVLLPASIELIIVPGTAFDRKGNRLGAGGGFYDRFFSQHKFAPQCVTVALAFDYQVVDAVPVQPHDVAIDFIITESQTIDCRK